MNRPPKTILVAIGGNALLPEGEPGHIPHQRDRARRTAAAIVQLVRDGCRVLITHGNGPQVGAALVRSECAADQVYPLPLDVCDATTQGEIGYLLQQALQSELARAGLDVAVATILTQVVVSPDDPAMGRPTKPVGPSYPAAEVERGRRSGWHLAADGEQRWRRVVPSPDPLEVVEEAVIRRLFESGTVVIAAGGGGIPVLRHGTTIEGVEAVIDKDSTSALLAARLGVDGLAIVMDLDRVYLHYREPDQRPLDRVTAGELEAWQHQGHFAPGSMAPKIRAALRFLRDGGREVVITSLDHLPSAVRGQGGTHIIPGSVEPLDQPAPLPIDR